MFAKTRWVSLQKHAPLTVLCFPYAGGGASYYRRWAEIVPPSIAIAPVQLPGREERFTEPCFERMSELVAAAADALQTVVPPPFVLFGHSMGGTVAYELAAELMRRGAPTPAHLFVSATPAPHLSATIPPIHDLPGDRFLEEVRRYHRLPDEVVNSPELLELILPRLRADFAVTGTYAWAKRAPLPIPITALSGSDDAIVAPAMIAAWRDHTVARFRHATFPGGHFFLDQHAPSVVSMLAQALE